MYRSVLKTLVLFSFLFVAFPSKGNVTPGRLIVELYFNNHMVGDVFVVRDSEGVFYVPEHVLLASEVVKPWPSPIVSLGTNYYSVSGFSGATADYDQLSLKLNLDFPATFLPLREMNLDRPYGVASREDLGAYIDYTFNWVGQDTNNTNLFNGFFTPVVFGRFGNVTANLNYNQSRQNVYLGDNQRDQSMTVLDMTYSFDDQEKMRSYRVGDVISRPGSQGRALRMGGIQIATNFSTQPQFVTFPLPSFYGESAVPTMLDIYVNGALQRRESVEAGRYQIDNLAVMNGAGELQVIARDEMGMQQQFSQDFYVSPSILRPGLSEYSFSLGALREGYALENFQYGDMVGAGFWRYGLREDLTIEGHTELTSTYTSLGGAIQKVVSFGGVLNTGLSLSNGETGSGSRWQLGYSRSDRKLNYNVELRGASESFEELSAFSQTPKLQLLSSIGKSVPVIGSLGLSLVHQQFDQQDSRTIVRANHNINYKRKANISSYVAYTKSEISDFSLGISFSIPLGNKHTTSTHIASNDTGFSMESEYRKHMPVGNGYGYHLGVQDYAHSSGYNAGVIGQNNVGTYSLETYVGDSNSWEASASGSVAFLGGSANFSRQIRNAFAVVDVGDYEGVRVYSENQEIGRTDKNGQLFVPGLQPYYSNHLSIEVDDLPLTAYVGKPSRAVTPFDKTGIVVDFNVRESSNLFFKIELPNGMPVPEGATVLISPQNLMSPVGADGQVFLQSVELSSLVQVYWGEYKCILDIPFDDIESLEQLTCSPDKIE